MPDVCRGVQRAIQCRTKILNKMEQMKNTIEWACEFKRYSQYEKARMAYDNGNKGFEDVLMVLAWMNPNWVRRYNKKEQV